MPISTPPSIASALDRSIRRLLGLAGRTSFLRHHTHLVPKCCVCVDCSPEDRKEQKKTAAETGRCGRGNLRASKKKKFCGGGSVLGRPHSSIGFSSLTRPHCLLILCSTIPKRSSMRNRSKTCVQESAKARPSKSSSECVRAHASPYCSIEGGSTCLEAHLGRGRGRNALGCIGGPLGLEETAERSLFQWRRAASGESVVTSRCDRRAKQNGESSQSEASRECATEIARGRYLRHGIGKPATTGRCGQQNPEREARQR